MTLKKLREAQGISQEALAKQLKVTLRTYLNYEAGLYPPKLETAKQISRILGITMDELYEIIANQ